MEGQIRNVCLINGSLRGKNASSLALLTDVDRAMRDGEYDKTVITVRARVKGSYPEDVLRSMARADALVLVFPLYDYGLPGALTRLLEDFYRFARAGSFERKRAKVYVIVNCGFPRPEITGEAVRVVRNFCRRLSLDWRFAIRIGGGPAVVMMRRLPLLDGGLKRAIAEIATDLGSGDTEVPNDYLIRPVIPEPILLAIKGYYERKGQMIERGNRQLQPA